MAGPVEEELAALAAIFCGPGEWEVLSRSETDGAVCRILTEAEGPTEDAAVPLELVFHLPAGYPSRAPGISVSSERPTRAQRAAVREGLLGRARSLPAEPRLQQLVLRAQQHLGRVLAPTGPGAGPGPRPPAVSATADEGPWMALLRLDHMRARTRYVKAVRQWASDLGLTGRLLFLGKAVLLLLQGRREDDIKEYLVLQKTCRVDVDASGRKCRERMLSVLVESPVQPGHSRFPAFEVREYAGVDELRREFEAAGLQGLFSEFVLGLVQGGGSRRVPGRQHCFFFVCFFFFAVVWVGFWGWITKITHKGTVLKSSGPELPPAGTSLHPCLAEAGVRVLKFVPCLTIDAHLSADERG